MSKELFHQQREAEIASQFGVSFEHLIDAKKENLKKAADNITEAVQKGDYDELKALILAKKGSELFAILEKQIRPLAEDKYVYKIGKDYAMHDVKIEASETGVKYDFTGCGDTEWNNLNTQATEINDKLKEREKFLKTVTKPLTIADDDTGEIVTIQPPVRSGKMGLKLTIR